jgi:hypothetical protein
MRTPSIFAVTPISILSESGFDYNYGVITDGETMLVVCTEGVAWEVRDDKPFHIGGDVYATRDGLDAMINKNLPGVGSPMMLNLWIRTFGSRLESNYVQVERWLWDHMRAKPGWATCHLDEV